MKHKLLAVNSGWYLEHPLLGKADIPPRVITGLARTWLVIFLDYDLGYFDKERDRTMC
jgi:hypothetical protein